MRMSQRNLEKHLILELITGDNAPIFAELQEGTFKGQSEKRHKSVYKLSSKYYSIMIIVYYKSVLKVINVIKTSKNMEQQWRKKVF